jgi:hypothetical protein
LARRRPWRVASSSSRTCSSPHPARGARCSNLASSSCLFARDGGSDRCQSSSGPSCSLTRGWRLPSMPAHRAGLHALRFRSAPASFRGERAAGPRVSRPQNWVLPRCRTCGNVALRRT